MKNGYVKTLFFLWHLAHIRSRPFQKISHDLIELCGVLGGDDGNACAFLDRLPCDSGGLTALAGNRHVLRECAWCFLLGNFRSGRLRQHIQHQLQRGHVITEVFLFEPFQVFVLAGRHPRPCTGDLIGEDGVLHALLNAAGIPFVRQFLADLDGLQPLVDPFAGIALFEIGFQRPLDGQLRVDGFLNALPTNLR